MASEGAGRGPIEQPGLWAAIRESIAGSQRDYTHGSLERAILLLAVPMVLEMCMESLFSVVDIFWVAHLGADAIATVALTESGLAVLFAIALGLSAAATAIVARRTGEKNARAAGIVAVQAIVAGLAISAATAALGVAYGRELLEVMGGSASVLKMGTGYTRTMLGGSSTIFLLFLINAVFRGAGDAATAMRALWIANIVNICLNPCLIFGLGPFPQLGVTGSAVGTTIGRGAGVLFQLWILSSGRSRVRVGRDDMRIDFEVLWSLLRLSLGGVLQYLVQMASWIGIIRIVASFGSAAVAANTLAIRIVVFAILPSWGLSNAAATLVGQNLGANRPDRAERSVWRTGLYNMLFLGGIGVLFIAFAEPLIAIFTTDPAVMPTAVASLRFLSFGYVSYAYGMVTTAAFNGAGDTVTPTLLNLISFWIVQIPVAYYLSFYTSLGVKGAFVAIVTGDTVLATLGVLLFRRGAWKRRKV